MDNIFECYLEHLTEDLNLLNSKQIIKAYRQHQKNPLKGFDDYLLNQVAPTVLEELQEVIFEKCWQYYDSHKERLIYEEANKKALSNL